MYLRLNNEIFSCIGRHQMSFFDFWKHIPSFRQTPIIVARIIMHVSLGSIADIDFETPFCRINYNSMEHCDIEYETLQDLS